MTARRVWLLWPVVVTGLAGAARAEPRGSARPAVASPVALAASSPSAAPVSDPPDPAVEDAAEANLESTADRQGLTFDASIGGGLIVGFGIPDSVGRGGVVTLRLGHVATPRTVITFEIAVTAALHRQPGSTATDTNTNSNLLAGARHYVNPSLWVRAGGGLGVYQGRGVLQPDPPPHMPNVPGDVTLVGPAVLGGVGIDLARFKWAVLCLDVAASAMINHAGVLATGGINLGLAFD